MTATYDHVHILHKLTTEFYQQVRLPYVQRFIPEPIMNPMQAKLLLIMLEDAEISSPSQHSITLAALLVQAAMDTHDRIGTLEVSSEIERKQRQLTVLAGDYYSSLYYSILAGRGEETYIKVMSNAVETINDAKMRILQASDIETSLFHLVTVKSALTTHIAEYLGFHDAADSLRQLFLIQILTETDELSANKFPINIHLIQSKRKIKESLEHIQRNENSSNRIQRIIFEEAVKRASASF
ncbi:heptaprenyl diphosphate synthase component 1 [Alkalicoccus daliensis]|uniref:Heptaprenyl diphosphate synthase n=1 Tax=Alkalicoccus daliensis TaxID=745820 RepID=A0A1H0AVZ8_9BACI|nr:heptaprenyl diphosphate synthase component 1 [Alkalicoccus daliensis]SDN37535.1 heptaprenyl diphosphate synthase [Alkalicoccus daliensis]